MEITDVEQAALADPTVMDAVREAKQPVSRPGIGIAIDRHKFKRYREAALLERIDLSQLTKAMQLRQLAAEQGITGCDDMDAGELVQALHGKAIAVPRHVGISRDAIAKIENGDRLRPKIATLRVLIDALNTALVARGEPEIGIRDLYATPEGPGDTGDVTAGETEPEN